MHKKIAIIDYGMGNIGSVFNSLKKLGAQVISSNDLVELALADAYILPGVGAFPRAMENFHKLGLKPFLNEQILQRKKPLLGICLGMQLLAQDSEEDKLTEGLGWIEGHVLKLQPEDKRSVPHVGWNNLSFTQSSPLMKNIENNAHFFFDHSFQFVCKDNNAVAAVCNYGGDIVSVVQKNNIFATQFHPEKSQRNGLKLLRNFINYTLRVQHA